jgi:trigger factor
VKLSFTLKPEEFNAALDRAFEKQVKNLEVPGFRKGKMPRSIFEKRYGEAALYEDAINFAVNDAYVAYLQKSKLNVVNYPELDVNFKTVGKDKKLKFTLEVEVYPTVELGQYKEIEVEKEKVEVTESDVTEYIDRILKQHAELEVVEGVSLENGHTAIFDFEGSVNGVPFEGGKAENYTLEIGSGNFIPGFEEQMVGMNVGEEKTITVKFPEEYHASDLAGKDAEFKLNLHEIKNRVVPTLSDEFVAEELEIENVKTVEQYKDFVKEVIEKERTEASENKFVDDLTNKVLENAKVEIPQGLINDEVERQVKQVEAQAKAYGLTTDLLLQYTGAGSLEQYKEAIKPGCEMQIKHRVVYLEIAKAEKIKVTAKDYKEELKVIAAEIKGTVEEAEARYSKEALTPYLQIKKVSELVKSTAIVK